MNKFILVALLLLLSAGQSFAENNTITNNDLYVSIARLDERMKASDNAVAVALKAIDARLEGMNEFRSTLKDQAGTFVTRREFWGFLSASIGFLLVAAGLFKLRRNGQ